MIRLQEVSAPLETPRPERRLHTRYPIALDLQYTVINGDQITCVESSGTLNFSSSGILFKANEPVPEQGQIELVVNWPVPLDGVCHLSFVALGRTVRNDTNGTAVEVMRHGLRTTKRPATSS